MQSSPSVFCNASQRLKSRSKLLTQASEESKKKKKRSEDKLINVKNKEREREKDKRKSVDKQILFLYFFFISGKITACFKQHLPVRRLASENSARFASCFSLS
jgi:hypothetical protein